MSVLGLDHVRTEHVLEASPQAPCEPSLAVSPCTFPSLRFPFSPLLPSSAFDMYLVVERRRLPAHKAILALRSVALAELIAREEESARGGDASATVELVRSLLCS